ncbi:MAG: C25 family cysteine peptidase [Myxococcales bacterium]|jgi:hypothetical protein
MKRALVVVSLLCGSLAIGEAYASTCPGLSDSCECLSADGCNNLYACRISGGRHQQRLCDGSAAVCDIDQEYCAGDLLYAAGMSWTDCFDYKYRCAPKNINIVERLEGECVDCQGCIERVATFSICSEGQACYTVGGDPFCGTLAGVTSFTAIGHGSGNALRWTTGTERGNLGFNLYRVDAKGSEVRINQKLLPGKLNTPVGDEYELFDAAGTPSDRYILEWIDASGRAERKGPVAVTRARLERLEPRFDVSAVRLKAKAIREELARFSPRKAPDASAPSAINIFVRRTGFVRVPVSEIAALGLPVVGKRAADLSLTHGGQPVGFAASATELTNDDYLEFYGLENLDRHSAENAYVLAIDAAGSRAIGPLSSAPKGGAQNAGYLAEERIEENHIYALSAQVPDGFYWTYLSLANPEQAFRFELTDLAPGAETARLEGRLDGVSSLNDVENDHHYQVLINGNLAADARWDGLNLHRFDVEIPASWLVEGTNEIVVRHGGDPAGQYDSIGVDGFSLRYRRKLVAKQGALQFTDSGLAGDLVVGGFDQPAIAVFDVTQPAAPRRLTDVEVTEQQGKFQVRFARPPDLGTNPGAFVALAEPAYLAPERLAARLKTTLRDRGNAADLLVIAHEAFVLAIEPLIAKRRSQGLRVAVATTSEVFDEFGHGNASDQAIKDFIAYAYSSWTAPAPRHVLLVGDTTNDPRDYLQLGLLNYVPSHPVSSELWGGTTSDNWYGDLDGDGSYELSVGRLSVTTPAEAETLVRKLVGYGDTSRERPGARRVLFVADKSEPYEKFEEQLERLAALVPPTYEVVRVLLRDFESVEAARAKISEELGKGSVLVVYLGHGSGLSLGRGAVFRARDIEALPSGVQVPLVVSFSCVNGYVGYPGLDILAEAFIKPEDKGAIASWMPADIGSPGVHEWLGAAFLEHLFSNGGQEVGSSVRAALNSLLEQQVDEEARGHVRAIAESFTFLGDPSLQLEIDEPSSPPDAGIPTQPDSGAGHPESDAGQPGSSAQPSDEPTSCQGCGAAGSSAATGALLLAAMAFAALLRRRAQG